MGWEGLAPILAALASGWPETGLAPVPALRSLWEPHSMVLGLRGWAGVQGFNQAPGTAG